MKKFYFSLILLCYTLIGCNQSNRSTVDKPTIRGSTPSGAAYKPDESVLKSCKKVTDKLVLKAKNFIVLVKEQGKSELKLVKGDDYPDDTETTYNILIDKDGEIIFAAEMPYSESGDWFIGYKSYFDSKGKLYAFERDTNFFNSECTGDENNSIVKEKLIKYYRSDGGLIDSVYSIKGEHEKPIKKSDCISDYDYPYKVINNLGDYLKINNIKLSKSSDRS